MAREISFEGAALYPLQRAAIYDDARFSLIEASTKSGKAQPLHSLVQTDCGAKEMRDIKVGDRVCDVSGGFGSVLGVFPQGEKDVYRVTFSDGVSVECCLDHLWEVRGQVGGARVVNLAEIRCLPYEILRRTWVPVAAPVQYPTLVTNGYLLGALIGDGGFTSETLKFSSVDDQILARVSAQLPENCRLSHSSRCDFAIVDGDRELGAYRNRVISWLRDLDLWGLGSHDKFIPKLYKRSTIDSRWDLIRGLMDTDGYVDSLGQPHFETTSERLAYDFQEVVQSLGGMVAIRTKRGSYRTESGIKIECKMVYRCRVTHPDATKFFLLQRKLDRCLQKKKPMKRTFRKIEFVRRAQTQCIQVDSERGLYLTDNFVVTHNTVGCIAWIIEQGICGSKDQNFWWIAPVYKQAEIAFRRCWMYLRPIQNHCKRNISSMFIELPNGVRIWFLSGERPDDLYGEDVYGAVLDEASRMREEAWHAVRSTLTYTQGPARIIGNVRGKKNWFYRLSRLAESGEGGYAYHRLTAFDAVTAGVLDASEVDHARKDFERLGQEEVFRQLYLAEALDEASNPFGLKAISDCCKGVTGYSSQRPVAAGVDLAGRGSVNVERVGDAESRDWTSICLMDKEGYLTSIDRFRKPHLETMNEIVRRVGRTRAIVDSTGQGDAVVESLQRRGDMQVLGFMFTERSRQDLLEGLALAIQDGNVKFPDVRSTDGKSSLREELEAFEYQYTARGVRYEVPEGCSDDMAMALALCVKRMPWRRQSSMRPTVVSKPAGLQWSTKADGSPEYEAWRKYTESKKPTLSPPAEEEERKVNVPEIVMGPALNRWNAAG